ncbi:unnamed protein product [Rotaria sp. Silwood2]|nr:unnamed protein product [Rotaria sp. Silwood2]CAF2742719.1 unnamed protein product [Rotaria sp. Silwood2]CAF3152689.1 unnamed protein product [Rotaria sp. Silwood2]CAF4493183.1 unnamed protein product [Rotaria sp. Silwood2]
MLVDELNTKESSGLLSTVDRMREILHNEKITLPEIVVVGDQSVGKSSVLEAISGIQLPRAQNICTRCPLELRMKSTIATEYAVIRSSKCSENEAETLYDMNEISNVVTRLTKEIAGEGTNVSSTPIYLTVYKRNMAYDLTLIDLPGITRNPLPGQPKDIHAQILNLINKYIEPSTAVVLHVIPASVDFATSESMKLAKEYDPQCLRQLITATKIDKYDKGIAEKLLGRGPGAMQLKLGCIAVLNRNQDEIDQNISFEEMKKREAEFFIKHHEAFQYLPDEFKGIDQLVKKLAIIQQDRIRSTLPQVIEELRKQIREKTLELRNIPIPMTTEQDCWMKFQSMINAFRESIRTKINGDYDVSTRINMITVSNQASSKIHDSMMLSSLKTNENSINSISGDDRLAYHIYRFQRKFQDELTKNFSDFFSSDYYKLVLQVIDDGAGVSLPNFPSYQIIERLFHGELQRLPRTCFTLIERIRDYLKESLLRILHQTFDTQYIRLVEQLKDVIVKQIDMAADQATDRIQEILDMEYRIFTINNLYADKVNEMKERLNKKEKEQQGEAAPPAVTMAVVAPLTVQVDSLQKPDFKKLLKPISGSKTEALVSKPEDSTVKSEMLTSTSLNTSMMIPSSHKLTFNESLAAVDIQITLESYCLVVRKRIIDIISQICYHQFITKCALVIDQALTVACPSSDLLRFMKEPAEQTSRREHLIRTIKAYEDALRLGQGYL